MAAIAQSNSAPDDPCRKVTSPTQLADCTQGKFRAADAELLKAYTGYLTVLQQRVTDAQPGSAADKARATQSLDDLKAAQVAWASYREAECRAEADEYPSGNLQSTMHASCMETLTRQRIARLNDTYSDK